MTQGGTVCHFSYYTRVGKPSTKIIERSLEYLPTTIRQRLRQQQGWKLIHREHRKKEDGSEHDLWMVDKTSGHTPHIMYSIQYQHDR